MSSMTELDRLMKKLVVAWLSCRQQSNQKPKVSQLPFGAATGRRLASEEIQEIPFFESFQNAFDLSFPAYPAQLVDLAKSKSP